MISFLHTAQVHVSTFDRLLDELAPGMARRHRVEPGWLDEARVRGVCDELSQTIRTAMAELASGGAGVCTCSSIGAVAETAHTSTNPVIRIDRALMEAALAHGPQPLLAMCLESTRAPTMDLLLGVAATASVAAAPQVVMCEAAWPHFEAGDMQTFGKMIANAVAEQLQHGVQADCIVLAQASMACAEPLLEAAGLPVLSSPRLGVIKALQLLSTS